MNTFTGDNSIKILFGHHLKKGFTLKGNCDCNFKHGIDIFVVVFSTIELRITRRSVLQPFIYSDPSLQQLSKSYVL